MKPLLICVVGPTAIGKTNLAIELAKAFNTEIISADSRQFYKEMTIGTAVPTSEELAAAPHHFIQNKSIFESFTVGDFEREALLKLDELFKKHPVVILVGGSGLYVDAVTNGLDNFPEVSSLIRQELQNVLTNHGIEVLQNELKAADPEYYKKADIQNPHRIIRALEIIRGTGRPFSSFLKKKSVARKFRTEYIGIKADRPIVYERINKRVDLMMQSGLLSEAKELYPHREVNALQTVGYKELFAYLDGEYPLETAVSEIKKNTRRFAKRQGTWFRKNDAIRWFEAPVAVSDVLAVLKKQKTP
ncbi:tRNA (adenosine(37)-N6)-dimethylallyltransferase MiaA [Candidatus Ulvibacter alkanivorans]|uniref:tRNA (adenosine(37)-N6)-dimethylallyltransferase MiaA n=1 Tax=Candidatus Ulvibacter alkanivorans TaxID=2267620 RepID=UPI000DF23600|nr:tRNA (adenosine(37)-N6)-dimethylallyltransferase MiaA [Candidatus Ulvibacter alkanivorans]